MAPLQHLIAKFYLSQKNIKSTLWFTHAGPKFGIKWLILFLSSVSSRTFQLLPKSGNNAPLNLPRILNLYSRFKASLKLASLNSFEAPLLPGPNLYTCQARLSFEPPPKNDSENGIFFEFPYGIAIPEKYRNAISELSEIFQCLI